MGWLGSSDKKKKAKSLASAARTNQLIINNNASTRPTPPLSAVVEPTLMEKQQHYVELEEERKNIVYQETSDPTEPSSSGEKKQPLIVGTALSGEFSVQRGSRYGARGYSVSGEDEENSLWIKTKIPNLNSKRLWKQFKGSAGYCTCTALSTMPLWVMAFVAATAAGAVVAALYTAGRQITDHDIKVAFVGNSYVFVNDLPRLMETISDGRITQDSCLHGSGSISRILNTGNGMYNRWSTEDALIEEEYVDKYGATQTLYDYGACSVTQLLMGYDKALSYNNYKGNFYNDGTNPCFNDNSYLDYRQSFNSTNFDYVILTDQSKRMCFQESRDEALSALRYTYIPLFNETESTPVIVQPHAFYSESVNMTGLGDLATFTASIYDGALQYKDLLEQGGVPEVRIAPVGMAYLKVYEDSEEMWEKLFLEDLIHPSLYGSFLYGCVLYATLRGHMPRAHNVILEDMSDLWIHARKLQEGNWSYPDQGDANYLFSIAKKVVLQNKFPKTLPEVGNYTVYYDDYDSYTDDAANYND
jgi:hypothetical protein